MVPKMPVVSMQITEPGDAMHVGAFTGVIAFGFPAGVIIAFGFFIGGVIFIDIVEDLKERDFMNSSTSLATC